MFTKYKYTDLCRRSNNFAIDRLSRPQMKVQKKNTSCAQAQALHNT